MGEHQQSKVVAKVEIYMFGDGRVSVKGPIEDKVLSLGLLRVAEDIVLRHRGEQKNIIVPEMAIPPGVPS